MGEHQVSSKKDRFVNGVFKNHQICHIMTVPWEEGFEGAPAPAPACPPVAARLLGFTVLVGHQGYCSVGEGKEMEHVTMSHTLLLSLRFSFFLE